MLCLLLFAGTGIFAQADLRKESFEQTYLITELKMNEDGKWLAFRKSYDLNSDTILIYSTDNNNSVTRVGFNSYDFLADNHVLLTADEHAELLNLKSGKSLFIKNLKRTELVNGNRNIVFHYKKAVNNLLEIRDFKGSVLKHIENVSDFFVAKDNSIFFVRDSLGFQNLFSVTAPDKSIFSTNKKITEVAMAKYQNALIIHLADSHGSSAIELVMLKDNFIYYPQEIMDLRPLRIQINELNENTFMINVLVKEETSTQVDIWYGTDKQMHKKFSRNVKQHSFLWYPRTNKIQKFQNEYTYVNFGYKNHLLSFDPSMLQDYTQEYNDLVVSIFDLKDGIYNQLDTIASNLHASTDGKFLLSKRNKYWTLYDIQKFSKTVIKTEGLKLPYFTPDHKYITFESDNGLYIYNIQTAQISLLFSSNDYQTKILNYSTNSLVGGYNFFSNFIDFKKPILVKLFDPKTNKTALGKWWDGKFEIIIEPSLNYIHSFEFSKDFKKLSFVEENFNIPPRVKFIDTSKKEKLIYASNPKDKNICKIKQDILFYSSSEKQELKGVLYYPSNYDSTKKYPLIVHTYQLQSQKQNQFLHYKSSDGVGFNIRSLLNKGYFVLLPDVIVESKGPGISALECINNALDAIKNSSVDFNKVGLIGHSFGGYITNFIATRSDRFAAFVSGAGNADIIRSYHSFNFGSRNPEYQRVESGIYDFKIAFSADKKLYFENNPIYNAEKITAPVLLWSGKDDQNVPFTESVAFYLALKRNKKDVIALFYPDEQHNMINKNNQKDLLKRVEDWFGYFLKGLEAGWISKEIKKDTQ